MSHEHSEHSEHSDTWTHVSQRTHRPYLIRTFEWTIFTNVLMIKYQYSNEQISNRISNRISKQKLKNINIRMNKYQIEYQNRNKFRAQLMDSNIFIHLDSGWVAGVTWFARRPPLKFVLPLGWGAGPRKKSSDKLNFKGCRRTTHPREPRDHATHPRPNIKSWKKSWKKSSAKYNLMEKSSAKFKLQRVPPRKNVTRISWLSAESFSAKHWNWR